MKKLRILCLHGYHGSAKVLARQMHLLQQHLEHVAEFIYVDAPSLSHGDFGWWHAVEHSTQKTGPGVGHALVDYQGWATTYDWVLETFRTQGPFDGVLGFSQGAALTALLVGLRAPDARPGAQFPLAFDFAIMIGGFLANDPVLQSLYESKSSFDLPSVHVIGRTDFVVPQRFSYNVAALFTRPLVLEHDGGHVIDTAPRTCEQLVFFLEERQRQKLALRDPTRRTLSVDH
jgi:predicted esterase